MRDFLQSGGRFLRRWWFWAFVLIALPNCGLNSQGTPCPGPCDPPPCEGRDCERPRCEGADCPEPEPCEGLDCGPIEPPDPVLFFDPGPEPVTDTIMCEIPKPVGSANGPVTSSCATAAEAADPANVSLTEAAIALVSNNKSSIALDWSQAAVAECNGLPKKIEFLAGSFPDGHHLCLNCGQQIPMVYLTPTKACVAKCKDLIDFTFPDAFTPADRDAYCAANARTATNFEKNTCYEYGCLIGGSPHPNFIDPRRTPEKVMWTDFLGTAANQGNDYNTLSRTAPDSTPLAFDAGAASVQIIKSGDAWLEFETAATNQGHLLGVRPSCPDALQCPDTDPGQSATNALILHFDGQIYVQEGNPIAVVGPLGTYSAGQRYRVEVVDNHDGTATISFSKYTEACEPVSCAADLLYTSVFLPTYPLRVDASLIGLNATLANVTLVYIIQQ